MYMSYSILFTSDLRLLKKVTHFEHSNEKPFPNFHFFILSSILEVGFHCLNCLQIQNEPIICAKSVVFLFVLMFPSRIRLPCQK